MAHRIYCMSYVAKMQDLNWEEAFLYGELETVEEFETYEEAVAAFEERYIDSDVYGVE